MKVAVVGAGAAGLAAAWELKRAGFSVDIFEAHSKPGGCASYFRRAHENEKVLFDAGATVLWSLAEGDFLRQKLNQWKIATPPFHRHLFHRFSLDGKTFDLDARSEVAWTNSLIANFPQDKAFIEKHFPIFFKVSKALNNMLSQVPAEPFLNASHSLLNLKLLPRLLPLAPCFLKYPRDFSKLIQDCSLSFKSWMEMHLLITLQAKSADVDTLYAACALSFYPLGAGALEGGMASLFEALAKQFPAEDCKLHMRTPVLQISNAKGYLVHTPNHTFGPYSHVLLSCPRWNSQDLFGAPLFSSLGWEETKSKLWSAIVAYIVVKDDPRYPQEAFNHQVKHGADEIYFSVSRRDDKLRASAAWRVATASTHERLGKWDYADYCKKKDFPNRQNYEEQKSLHKEKFLRASQFVFSDSPAFIEVASPKTFLHYTQRKEGFVGGIPLRREFSFFNAPSQETRLTNVYQIGDTAFPGQSIVNCMIGAAEASRKILTSL